jgi:hypothetical protein
VLRPAIAGAIGPDAGRPEVLAFDALRSKVREPASAGQ